MNDQSPSLNWLIEKLAESLGHKPMPQKAIVYGSKNPEIVLNYAQEIQEVINRYNHLKNNPHLDHLKIEVFHNFQHTRQKHNADFPTFEAILQLVIVDPLLADKVFDELKNSTYFREIYEIASPDHELINLMIIFYRTSLLHLYPQLRTNQVQVSSTLEEMACLLYLTKQPTKVYPAVKEWIQNWQNEDFSPDLAKLVNLKDEV